jgi:hypothetical protein
MSDGQDAAETASLGSEKSDTVVLDLKDLLPDSGGEIVIHSAGLGMIGVSTGQTVTATGMTESHVTAAGENVSGFRYYQLEGGITLYCPADTSLRLEPEVGG